MLARLLLVVSGVLLGASASPAQDQTGSLAGTVRFLGKVPAPKVIITTDGGMLQHRDLVVDAKSKGLRDVVAILEDVPRAADAGKTDKVVIDQRDMIFIPRVVAVQGGQTVRFENNDLCNHAVMANSIEPANVFNVGTPQGSPFEYKFKSQKRPVVIGCPIHPWMRAWIYVLPHPYAAVSDASGAFRLSRVPPGTYTLQLHHPDTNRRDTRTVEIRTGESTMLEIDWND